MRLALVLLCLPVLSAVAQTPGQRTVLEAFRDSLARATDTVGLAGLEADMVAALRRNRSNPFDHARLGFLALRQADLGATRYFDDAAAEFQNVTRLAPTWPYGWYGLGLAEYGLVRSARAQRITAQTPYARASAALARAAIVDGRFADVLVAEAYRGRRERQPTRIAVMLDALRQAAEPYAPGPMILAALGRLEREFGEPTVALRSFESWLPQSGRSRGLALLEVARTRFLLDRLDGAAPYYEGAASDDSAAVRAYRGDLVYIAGESELQEFDRNTGRNRVEFLRRFWGRRDLAELRAPGERLREHYRRLYYARRTYPLYLPGRIGDPIAAAELPVDDRGMIYVRHGAPDDRVELTTMGVEPNESWRYAREDGDLLLHFVARHDPEVYRLVESLLDVAEVVQQQSSIASTLVSQGQEALLRSREQLSSIYRRDRRTSPERGRDFLLAERAMSGASLRTATTTDSYRHGFAVPLGLRADMALFPLDGSRATLHLAFVALFPVRTSVWLGDHLDYPLRLRLSAFTADDQHMTVIDTVVRPQTLQTRGERLLVGTFSTPVPNGRLQVRLIMQDGDTVGTVVPLHAFEPVSTGALALSDLAIGGVDDPWKVEPLAGESVGLLPTGELRRDAPAEVAYEIVSSAPEVRVQATLMRSDENAGVISSEAQVVAVPGGRRLVRQPLDTGKLRPGLYRLEVTVTGGPGDGLVRRTREFRIY